MENNGITLKEAFGKDRFKVSWKRFKELDYVCSIDGRKSEKCQRLSKELGIDWIEEV